MCKMLNLDVSFCKVILGASVPIFEQFTCLFHTIWVNCRDVI